MNRNKINHIINIIRSLKKPNTYKNIERSDVLFVCHDNDLGELIGKKVYSKTIDIMYDLFKKNEIKSAKFLLPYSYIPTDLIYIPSFYGNKKIFIAKLLDILLKTDNKFQIKAYKQIFKHIQCKYIIGIGLSNALCKAAHELEIFTVEVLHALGCPVVQTSWLNKDENYLPKGIILFDQISYEVLVKNFPPKTRFFKTYPFWLNQEYSFTLVSQNNFIAQKIKNYKNTILVSLQWGYDSEVDDFNGILENGVIHKNLIKAIEDTQDTIFWLLRFHPVQLRDKKYKHHISLINNLHQKYKNTESINASNLPLHTILPLIDGHITMISSLAYEASYFGVKTFFMCPTLKRGNKNENYYLDLEEAGFAVKGEADTAAILEWINSCSIGKEQNIIKEFSINEVIKWIELSYKDIYAK